MKLLIALTAFFLIAVLVFLACRKEHQNQPPVADAGPDQSFTLSSCSEKVTTQLDGSGSTDPNNKIIGYYWKQVAEQPGVTIQNQNSAKARVEILRPGTYSFALTVVNENYSSSTDVVLIIIRGTPMEYNMDVTFNGNYSYVDNQYDFYNCFYYRICNYTDRTEIQGIGNFPPFGQLSLQFTEEADSAASSYARNSNIQIYQGNVNSLSILGTSSVNLKKLRQQGGGSFTGTFTATDGSVKNCDPNVLKNLPPLNITGSIDTAARRATVTIKGKMYF
ncbi:MAG: PKD domain-containing protein [Bacteroidota bacterium]|nr:PKD domain-containing protein [Bacteroidota bacterium]